MKPRARRPLHGGVVIGRGAYGCVVQPSLACRLSKNATVIDARPDRLSKLFLDTDQASAFRVEARGEALFHRLDPHEVFHAGVSKDLEALRDETDDHRDGSFGLCLVDQLTRDDWDACTSSQDPRIGLKDFLGAPADASTATATDASASASASARVVRPRVPLATMPLRFVERARTMYDWLATVLPRAPPSLERLRAFVLALTTRLSLGLALMQGRVAHNDLHTMNVLIPTTADDATVPSSTEAFVIDFGMAQPFRDAVRQLAREAPPRWNRLPVEYVYLTDATLLNSDEVLALPLSVHDDLDPDTLDLVTAATTAPSSSAEAVVVVDSPYVVMLNSNRALFEAMTGGVKPFSAMLDSVVETFHAGLLRLGHGRAYGPEAAEALRIFEAERRDQFSLMVDLAFADFNEARVDATTMPDPRDRALYHDLARELRRVARLCCHPNPFHRPAPLDVYRHWVEFLNDVGLADRDRDWVPVHVPANDGDDDDDRRATVPVHRAVFDSMHVRDARVLFNRSRVARLRAFDDRLVNTRFLADTRAWARTSLANRDMDWPALHFADPAASSTSSSTMSTSSVTAPLRDGRSFSTAAASAAARLPLPASPVEEDERTSGRSPVSIAAARLPLPASPVEEDEP